LDAVVYHLHEMPRSFRAGMDEPTVVGSEVFQHWKASVEDLLLRSHHQAVAVVLTPDAAGCSRVHVVHALGLDPGAVIKRELPVRVPAVDDDVAGIA